MFRCLITLLSLLSIFSAHSFEPDWSLQATLPKEGHRKNIYQLPEKEFKEYVRKGQIHALQYPVEVTGVILPFRPLQKLLDADSKNPLLKFLRKAVGKRAPFTTEEGFYKWMGLSPFPEETATGVFKIPYPDGFRPKYYMGSTILKNKDNISTWGFSCAACHSQNLFGKPVLGLFNKRPRANEIFVLGQKAIKNMPTSLFRIGAGATKAEAEILKKTKNNIRAVGIKRPETLGLDTSLPQLALSLAKRNPDAYASKSRHFEKHPRPNPLSHFVADSKPGTWWLMKYKTRWLADGSIVAGNPIFTNFLWNEIGRGTDLRELEGWLKENMKTVKELTAAVFANEAPRWSDFPLRKVDLLAAKAGEQHFNLACKRCHGRYEKAWSEPNSDELSYQEIIKTTRVHYTRKTRPKDVGTDPGRYQGIKFFSGDLNRLAISKWMKTVVKPQKGYIAPPLVGIWARYPFFHNNSIPNLCALMMAPEKRPQSFYQGPSLDPDTDFDQDCVGYPVGDKIPASWKKEKEARYDTSRVGMSSAGHWDMFLDNDGQEIFKKEEKRELREFLKTL